MEHSVKEMVKSEIRNLVHMQHSIDKYKLLQMSNNEIEF